MRTLNQNTLCRMEGYIKEYQTENGRSPSYRNIMHFMGMSSLNLVQRYVLALEREGRIQRTRLGNIDLPPQLDKGETTIAPLIGAIACGEPCLAIEHIEDSFELPRSLFGSGKLFMLHASGNSMVDVGIDDGDLIVLRKQDYAYDGEIVVALTNGNNTLKRLYHRNGKIVLHPENKMMKDNVDSTFGVVKWDKRTRYFGGRLVQSSYQFLNTLGLKEQEVEALLQPSMDYISLIRKDIDFMRYHFTDAFAREKDEEAENLNGLAERADVIFTLMHKCPHFDETELYGNFRNDVVKSLKERLKRGHILLNGTNATLFGNGTELLKYIAGEEIISELKSGQIRCERFENGAKLLCARSPHITMGNLYLVENNLDGDIWDYFDLGENIVCVNAIEENIQQRLNGCDYDSDTMLITDDKLLVETAEKYDTLFKVPVCNIKSGGDASNTLFELDHRTSENKIGEIVNLSQKLNSIIWNKLNNGASTADILPIYEDVCKLSVLSGLEIDKAKRAYDNVNVGTELNALRKKYNDPAPIFFREIYENVKDKQYAFYDTAMDYIYKFVNKVQFRKGREQFNLTIPISVSLSYNIASGIGKDRKHP